MIERLVRAVIRDLTERSSRSSVSSLSAAELPGETADVPVSIDLAELGSYSRGFEDELLDALAEGKSTEQIAHRQLSAAEPRSLSVEYHHLSVGGKERPCVDIQDASALLNRSIATLRRRHKKEEIGFVWYRGRRYLPVDQLQAAQIVLRPMGEWEEMLGVSRQTVHKWMSELPDDIDPVEMEARLKDRAEARRR